MRLLDERFSSTLRLEGAADLKDPAKPVLVLTVHGDYVQWPPAENHTEALRKLTLDASLLFRTETQVDEEIRIVLNLSDYSYSWGDDFDDIMDVFGISKKYALVVGPRCRRGISTLMAWDPNTEYDCVEHPSIFLEFSKAIDHVRGL